MCRSLPWSFFRDPMEQGPTPPPPRWARGCAGASVLLASTRPLPPSHIHPPRSAPSPGPRSRRTSQRSEPLDPLGLTQKPLTANLGMPAKDPPSAQPPPQLTLPWSTLGQLGPSAAFPGPQPASPCLDRVGRKVPDEVGGVRVVHHGQHGEGVAGEPEELGQVLAGEWLAGAELLADRVVRCRERAG